MIVIFLVLRQVEDQLVMPVVIGRAVHLHPVVTIFAVLIGLEVYGVLGGLLGVPAAAAINVIFNTLYPHGIEALEATFAEVPQPALGAEPRAEGPAPPGTPPSAAPGIPAAIATEPAVEATRAQD